MIIVLDEGYRTSVSGRFPGADVRFFPNTLTDPEAFADYIRPAEVLGLRRALPFPFDRRLIEQATGLQFVHKSGSGADWFDVDAMTDSGIMLAVNFGFNAGSVAEHTIMLMLMCLRSGFGYMEPLRRGVWAREGALFPPRLLNGKTVGVVGMGAIGTGVARALVGLGANVIAHQRSPLRPSPGLEDVESVHFDDLLRRSDVVTLHVPHTAETERMIGARELTLMKPDAILINTSRGKVVDERALYEALREGRIRGAGLDVYEQEPTAADNPLLALENVCATPHVGGVAEELEARQTEGTLANIERFLDGMVPERLVNPKVLDRGTRASL